MDGSAPYRKQELTTYDFGQILTGTDPPSSLAFSLISTLQKVMSAAMGDLPWFYFCFHTPFLSPLRLLDISCSSRGHRPWLQNQLRFGGWDNTIGTTGPRHLALIILRLLFGPSRQWWSRWCYINSGFGMMIVSKKKKWVRLQSQRYEYDIVIHHSVSRRNHLYQ